MSKPTLTKRISRRKNDIAIIVIWTALIVLVVVKAYWLAYNTSARLLEAKPPVPGYEGPRPDNFELLLVGIAGVLVGLFLSDVGEMLYGYIATMTLSFVVSVAYASVYIWYILGWGAIIQSAAFSWEWAIYFAVRVIFTIMFPWVVSVCLIAVALGAFLRTWVGWS